jgi:serine/threonine protein kinase
MGKLDDDSGRQVNKHLMEKPSVAERFLREIRAVAKLRHPNIVTTDTAYRVGEGLVFAMEYVKGHDMAKYVKGVGPVRVDHACNFIYQASLGLQHAFEEGLVHRDITPGNLMLSKRGDRPLIKVLDFGLSKAAREHQVDSALTHVAQMLGTPDYIAPEQIRDAQSADTRADIYSLGCTLYYLLSGKPPFEAVSLYDLFQAHHSMDAKPLNFVRSEVRTELAALVAKMMAKEPHRRFQTPGEVAEAIKPFFKPGGRSGFDGRAVGCRAAGGWSGTIQCEPGAGRARDEGRATRSRSQETGGGDPQGASVGEPDQARGDGTLRGGGTGC